MDVRGVLKQSATVVGLVRDSKKILNLPSHLANRAFQKKTIKNYLASNETKKLQIGAGATSLEGWLSTDIAPQSNGVVHLDATKPFPFNDNTFSYVYSEHMIEHIHWRDGLFMLRECRRVLKPDGTIRIATPDLETLIGLYGSNGHPLNTKYIEWITDKFLRDINAYKASFVINNAFHNWGHQFLYDSELLEMAMREAGFIDIQRCSYGESDDENLRGIETHGKNVANDEMVAFETMFFEGKCAA